MEAMLFEMVEAEVEAEAVNSQISLLEAEAEAEAVQKSTASVSLVNTTTNDNGLLHDQCYVIVLDVN